MANQDDMSEHLHPVRERRESIGLTREGLAFKTGLTVRTIERIEAGHVTPQRVSRRAIAAVLGCDTGELGWPDEVAA